jgi:hypothetical protein
MSSQWIQIESRQSKPMPYREIGVNLPNSMIDPAFLMLLRDMDALISGQLSPPDFESRFIDNNSNLRFETVGGHPLGYEVYQKLFYVVDAYVADPALRTDLEDLGDDDLLSAVKTAWKEFTAELAALGFDLYGCPNPS